MQLVDMSDSKPESCEFESRHPHQLEFTRNTKFVIINLGMTSAFTTNVLKHPPTMEGPP